MEDPKAYIKHMQQEKVELVSCDVDVETQQNLIIISYVKVGNQRDIYEVIRHQK